MKEAHKRVKAVMEHFNLNKNSFSKAIGYNQNTTIGRLINEGRKPSQKTLDMIVVRFPEISMEWLLTGRGEMLTEPKLSAKERVKKLCDFTNKTAYEIAVDINLSYAYFKNIDEGRNTEITKDFADRIAKAYPRIKLEWLLTGEGKMLRDQTIQPKDQPNQSLIPMYDVEAIGGSNLADTSAVTKPTRMINIGDFLKDSEAAIRVYGNSMLPGYPSGCIIGTRLITGTVIEWGEVYVIETRDSRYIKRIYNNNDSNITCYSDNTKEYTEGARKGKPLYEPFDVPKDEIIRYHRVVGVIKRNDNSVV